MMKFVQALKCPINLKNHSADSLQKIFDWYVGLNIPYETLSNIESSILVKNADQMLTTVLAGGGGHCVEHSVLLEQVLRDLGFTATLINADHYDHLSNRLVRISKPLVVVDLDNESWVCDPYYRSIVFPLPSEDFLSWKSFVISRQNQKEFRITRIRNGKPIDEDRANFSWTIETRRKQFEDRYQLFSPFGVTAPFYQFLRPVRKALFYSPRYDCLLQAENGVYRLIDEHQMKSIEWLPNSISVQITAVLPTLRKQRKESLKFLNSGLFPPYYELLKNDTFPALQKSEQKTS